MNRKRWKNKGWKLCRRLVSGSRFVELYTPAERGELLCHTPVCLLAVDEPCEKHTATLSLTQVWRLKCDLERILAAATDAAGTRTGARERGRA